MYELMDFIKINKVIILLTIGERNGFHLLFIFSSSIAYETGYYCALPYSMRSPHYFLWESLYKKGPKCAYL